MRILLVEDDSRAREFLGKGLRETGYTVDSVGDGTEGLFHALDQDYDLVILDVMLPGLDGWTVVQRLRARGRSVPVLFLTARDAVSDRVKGLELGADDYLVKPFAWAEFLARVRTLLRRPASRQAEVITIGDMEIETARRRVKRGGRVIDLTPKEFQLLYLMATRRGELLSRVTLVEQVWDMNFATDSNAVDVALGRLRRKLDAPFPRKLIHTVRGLGYMLDDHGDS